MPSELSETISRPNTWRRILYMLLFVFILWVARVVLWTIVLFQVLTSLVTGAPTVPAIKLGRIVSSYVYEVLLFLTFNTDKVPFPFSELDTQAGDAPSSGAPR